MSKKMKNTILHVKDLACGYPGKTVLQELNFEIAAGEMVSILGTNGSGKTTLLKTISGSISPRRGDVFVNGSNIRSLSLRDFSTEIAVVMQFQEVAHMTVQEYVLLGRLPYFKKFQFFETRQDLKLVHRFLELTDTLKLRDTPFDQISGGEKQLVAIVRALVQEPSLLLLDEPTSHLDISHQSRILNLIHDMKKELGLAVLIVIHDLNLASEYSDHLVLVDGKTRTVHSSGKPEDVITKEGIESVYGTRVIVKNLPLSGRPSVFISRS